MGTSVILSLQFGNKSMCNATLKEKKLNSDIFEKGYWLYLKTIYIQEDGLSF
jgi:hypothetical protein